MFLKQKEIQNKKNSSFYFIKNNINIKRTLEDLMLVCFFYFLFCSSSTKDNILYASMCLFVNFLYELDEMDGSWGYIELGLF